MGIALGDTLTRGESGLGAFPTTIEADAKISHVVVDDPAGRAAIPEWKRLSNMSAYEISTGFTYRMDNNISSPTWTQIPDAIADPVSQAELYDIDGYIKPSLMRNLFINDAFVVADEAAMVALTSVTGNIFVLTDAPDTGEVWLKINDDDPADISDFAEITSAAGSVTTVNGQTGTVEIDFTTLLTFGSSSTQFAAAVAANATVLSNASSISTNTADIATNTSDIAALQAATGGVIQIYDALATYTTDEFILGTSGAGVFDLFKANQSTNPGDSPYVETAKYDQVGDYYRTSTIDSLLGDKADLVGGLVPLTQLPASAKVSTFLGLTDVNPSTYVGQAGKLVRVHSGETYLEFTTSGGGSTTFEGLTDTPTFASGTAFDILQLNAGKTALEWTTLSGGGDALVANPISQFAGITSSAVTTGFMLIADGAGYVGRALLEADISDFGSYAAASHTHVIADVTDFTDNSANWDTAFGWGDHSGNYWALTGTSTLTGSVIIAGDGLKDITLGNTTNPLNAFKVWSDFEVEIQVQDGSFNFGRLDLSNSEATLSTYNAGNGDTNVLYLQNGRLDWNVDGSNSSGGRVVTYIDTHAGTTTSEYKIDLSPAGEDGVFVLKSANSTATFDGAGGVKGWQYTTDISSGQGDRWLPDLGFFLGTSASKLDRLQLNLTTGDVATPVEGQIWYNNTSNKFRAFEGAAAVDMIGGGGGGAFTADGNSLIAPTSAITLNQATGNEVALTLNYTTNKATSGNDTGLLINQTDTLSPGTSLLFDAQVGGVSVMAVSQTEVNFSKDITLVGLEKLIFDGSGGDDYIYGAADGIIDLYLNNSQQIRWGTNYMKSADNTGYYFYKSTAAAGANADWTWGDDLDTGIEKIGADNFGFMAGGTSIANVTTTALAVTENLSVAATKNLYFDGGGDTYISEVSANSLRITAGGATGYEFTSTYFRSMTAGAASMRRTSNAPTDLVYGFRGNEDTGMDLVGTGNLGLYAGAVKGIDILKATTSTNVGFFGASYGTGDGVIFIGDATTVPSTNPVGGGLLYVEGLAIKFRDDAGTITDLTAGGGASALNDLTDVTISTVALNNILVYDTTGTAFKNVAMSGDATISAGVITIEASAITNAKMANMAAWTLKLNNSAGAAAPGDVKVSSLTEAGSPTTGDWILGEISTGELRKYNVGNLPTGGGGEANTISSLGGGLDIQGGKSGVDLRVNTISASGGNGITVSLATNLITVDFDSTTLPVGGTLLATDHLVASNGTASEKQLISAIPLSIFSNDSGWTSNAGTVTSVTGGVGVTSTGGATPDISLDFSELTDMVGAVSGTTEIILQDGTTESRKAISEIDLSFFSNDSGWTSNVGTVTSVTGGTGIASTGGATPSLSLTVDELAEKTGAVVGTDRLVGTTGTTNWAETISGIPLSIFNDDLGHVENVVGNLGFTVSTGEITTTNGTNITIGSFGTANTNYGFVVGSNSVGATYYLDATGAWSIPAGGGGASTSLNNLTATSINLSLISDTDITDDLGTAALRWKDVYAATLGTGDTATDTFILRGYDVGAVGYNTFITITAHATVPTMVIANPEGGTTITTNDLDVANQLDISFTPADATAGAHILLRDNTTGLLEKLAIGSGLSISGTDLTSTGGSASDSFKTWTIDNSDSEYTWLGTDGNLVAGSATDTIILVAGVGMSLDREITPNAVRFTADTVATDTLWDAAGDLAYATAADTGARLGIGTANQVLQVNTGATAPEWTSDLASTLLTQGTKTTAVTSYTFLASDRGKVIYFTAGTTVTATVNTGLGAGFWCTIIKQGAGDVTIAAGGGVTLQGTGTVSTQYSGASINMTDVSETFSVLLGDVNSIVGITGTKAEFDTAVTDGNFMYIGDAPTAHTHLLAAGATDVTATATEVNLLDLSGLTVGWVLSADSATTASWKAPTGGGGDMLLGTIQTVTAEKSFNDNTLKLNAATGGRTAILALQDTAGTNTITFPNTTATVVVTTLSQNVNNKTLGTGTQIPIIYDTNGNEVLQTNTTASAVNHIGITNSATGVYPIIRGHGEADLGLSFQDTDGAEIVRFVTTSAPISYWKLTAANSGGTMRLEPDGSDGNVAVTLASKGSDDINLEAGGVTSMRVTSTDLRSNVAASFSLTRAGSTTIAANIRPRATSSAGLGSTADEVVQMIANSATSQEWTSAGVELFGTGGSMGGTIAGVGVLRLNDATTNPTGTVTGGGILYVDGNTLNYLDAAGTVTDLTAAGGSGTVTSVDAGDGMTFTSITGTGSVTMGTPETVTGATTNSVSTNGHTHTLTIASTDLSDTSNIVLNNQANTFTANSKQSFTGGGTTAGFHLVPQTGDPSGLADGDMWYDNTGSDHLRIRKGTVSETIPTLGTLLTSGVPYTISTTNSTLGTSSNFTFNGTTVTIENLNMGNDIVMQSNSITGLLNIDFSNNGKFRSSITNGFSYQFSVYDGSTHQTWGTATTGTGGAGHTAVFNKPSGGSFSITSSDAITTDALDISTSMDISFTPADAAAGAHILLRDNTTGLLEKLAIGSGLSINGTDLESSGGGEVFAWTANHDASTFALEAPKFADATTPTKQLALDLSAITAVTTRTWTVPDRDIDFTAGGTFVDLVGTPANNELAVFTGDGTLEGESSILVDSVARSIVMNFTGGSALASFGTSGVNTQIGELNITSGATGNVLTYFKQNGTTRGVISYENTGSEFRFGTAAASGSINLYTQDVRALTISAAQKITFDSAPNAGALTDNTDKLLVRASTGELQQITLTGTASGSTYLAGNSTWAKIPYSKSITIESPTATEDISMFFTNAAITISEIRAVVRGTTPSVTWTVRHGTDRSATGAEAVTGGTATTSATTGSDVTSFNDATIVADSFVWLETTAQTGTVDELNITIFYTLD